MADYHTVETGAPHVYHNNDNCPDGKKIKKEHKKSGRGTGRHLCKECAKLAAK